MFAQKLEKMRKVLIPTDFTVESLQLVEYAILNFPDTKLDIRLVSGYRMPNTRWALIHFNESELVRKQFTKSFKNAKRRILREHNNNIERLTFELFTGVNSFAFENLLEQIDTDDAIVPKGTALNGSSNNWFDTTNLIKKNVKNVIEVQMEPTEEVPQKKFSLISLFNL